MSPPHFGIGPAFLIAASNAVAVARLVFQGQTADWYLSTGAVAGIVGGVAAAGAGAAVAVKGGEGENSEGRGTSYSGQYTVNQVAVGNVTNTCSFLRSLSGAMKVKLRQGSSSPGEAQLDLVEDSISVSGGCGGTGPGCCGPNAFMCVLTGTTGSMACAEQRTTTATGNSNTRSFNFSGSLSGGAVSGVITYGSAGQGTTNGSNATHSGSTSITVSLR